MRISRLVPLLALVSLLAPQAARGDGFIIVDRPVHVEHWHHWHPPHPPHPPMPRPRPRPIHQYLPLEVREHHVKVDIDGSVATTSVDQTFFNPSGQRLEGTYIFPIPIGAEIDKFEMDINGELVEAELLDAGKARGIYEEIVRKARDPALMEYSTQGMFKVRIFPIEPNSEKRIKIKYTQVLTRDGRITEYLYPLNTEKFSSRPIKSVSIRVDIESDHELKSIYSPSHDVEVSRKGKRRAVVGFEESGTKPDTDFKLFFAYDGRNGAPVGLEFLTHAEKGREGYYMMLLSPGAWEDERVVPKDVVFAVDTSGSMRVKKLDQAKAALAFCIDNLGPKDRFEIVRYSTEAEGLFEELSPASKDNLKEAAEFVDGLKAGGGTAIEEALLMAVGHAAERRDNDRPFQVIFLTDGRPTIGETRVDKIMERLNESMKEVDGTVRVFSFGIGTDINTKLLDRIAEDTRAVTEYVLPEEDIEHKVSRFYAKIAEPVMANLKIRTTDGVRLSKRHPGDLPDLFKGDQLVLFGRYSVKDGDDVEPVVILEGSLAGERKTFRYDVSFNRKARHSFIPRLWATRRVGYLLDEIRLRGEKGELKDEVVKLARRFGIVTPYTSYLIIEDEEARGVPVARQSMGNRDAAPLLAAAPGADGAVRGFGGGALPADASSEELESFRRKAEADAFEDLAKAESGAGAVAGARANWELKRARAGTADEKAYLESGYAQGVRFAPQVTRQIAGKTFYQNGDMWVDAEVPEKEAEEEEVTEIEFGSKEYFALLDRGGATAQWLSVGGNLQIMIGEKLYQIVSRKS